MLKDMGNKAQENIERVHSHESIEVNGKIITYEELIHEYGPEGLYEIANKLKSYADDDFYEGMNVTYEN
jgi:hypothetical protein